MRRLAALAVLLLVSCTGYLRAQSTNASLTGCITDSSKAVIADAKVIVINVGTNTRHEGITDKTGNYYVTDLPPGTYRVEVERPGFKTVVKPEVILHIQDTIAINFEMAVGSVSEIVTVTGGQQLVQTETTTLGHVVDETAIENIPLVSRNYTQIVALSPGVAADVTDTSQLGRNSQDVFVSGLGNTANGFQMDGIEISNFGSNRAGETFGLYGGIPIPNPDAIEEFKVQTSLYDASNGGSTGANVAVVTKSGTNKLHGTAFEFFRNDALNANNFFSNRNGQKRSVLKQNQFGGTLGGPVRKDKLFFFGSYQGTRQVNGVGSNGLQTAVLPPLTDDRSASTLGTQFCGETGSFGGVAVACDGSNINPVALNLLNFKLPNGSYFIPTPQVIRPDGTGFSVFSIPAQWDEDQFVANADYVLSTKHTLSEHFFFSRDPETLPFFAGANLPGDPYIVHLQNRNLALKLSSAFSPSLFNQAQFGFMYNLSNTLPEKLLKSSDFGITGPDPAVPDLLGIGVAGFSINPGVASSGEALVEGFSWTDQISWSHHGHNIRAGFEIQRKQYNVDLTPNKAGEMTMLTFPDFLLGQSAAQNGTQYSNVFACYTLAGDLTRQMRGTDWAVYLQDDIKVSSRLTVNAGLRWQSFGQLADNRGRSTDFWPEIADNDLSQGQSFSGYVVPANYKDSLPAGVFRNSNKSCCRDATPGRWGPRVGLAWKPLKENDGLVMRVGYGVFYTSTAGNIVGPVALTIPPFSESINPSGPTNSLATLQQPFNPMPLPDSAFPIWLPRTLNSLFSFNAISPDLRPPLAQAFSLNLQKAIARDFVFEVGYVGTRATGLNLFIPYNQASLASPENPVNGVTTNTVENAYLRVPVLGFFPSAGEMKNSGSSWYNALQVSVRKRLSRGFEFQASYTFDKSLDDLPNSLADSGTHGGFYDGNLRDLHSRWGPSDFDRPQRFVFSYVWELPVFRQQQGFLGKALGGWQLSGVTTVQSGHRLTVEDPSSGTIYGGAMFGGAGPAQLCPGKTNADIPTRGSITSRLNNYLNADVFCAPPAIGDGFGFGDLHRGVFSGPPQDNSDIALAKRISLEQLHDSSLEFRAEFFNAFNHPQFADPSSGCIFGCGIGNPSFNQIIATSVSPRIIQFALKYSF